MDYYYRSFTHEIILQRIDRTVIKAFPMLAPNAPNLPQVTIIKIFNAPEVPPEVHLHCYLSSKDSSILKVYDHWSQEQMYLMCIEFCACGDLHRELEKLNGSPYNYSFILQKLKEIGYCIKIMHSLGIAHRDIKPLNVYITQNQEFKLADFGEAKFIMDQEDFHTIRGTPYYMSPETFNRHNNGVSMKVSPFRDDIWGLARTFLEIGAGRLCPELINYKNEELHETVRKILRPFNYPTGFSDLICEMMPKEIKGYPSADQVYQKILNLIKDNEDYVLQQERINNKALPPYVSLSERKNSESKILPIKQPEPRQNIIDYSDYSLKDQMNLLCSESSSSSSSSETSSDSDYISGRYSIEGKSNGKMISAKIVPSIVNPSQMNQFSPPNNGSNLSSNIPPPIAKQNSNLPAYVPPPIPKPNPRVVLEPKNPPVASIPIENGPPIIQGQFSNEKKKIDAQISGVNAPSNKIEENKNRMVDSWFIPSTDPKYTPEKIQVPTNEPIIPGKISSSASKISENPNALEVQSEIPVNRNSDSEERKVPQCLKCSECQSTYSDPVVLDCQHTYHKPCFKGYLTKVIPKAKTLDQIICTQCKKPVSENIINSFAGLDPKTAILAKILYFQCVTIYCPTCKGVMPYKMLKEKEPVFDRCTSCDTKFCSFCERLGAHRFSCDNFNKFKKGKAG